MWFGGCQSQVEQSLELNQQAEGVKKEEAGIHFVLQIRLKFHLPLLPRHTPPCPPHLPFPFPPSTTQSYFPSYLNSEGTSAIRLLCPWIGEDPLEEEMATHSNILAWRIPWTEEAGGLQSTGSQRVRHD